ncbi:Hyaluronan synthase [compost metagenome]
MSIRPLFTPSYIEKQQHDSHWFLGHVDNIRNNISRFHHETPDVSVIIPAYNEEESILRTLSSVSETITTLKVEILVVNNNSTDRTQELLDNCGVRNIMETKKGVKHARNSGLNAAKGRIIMNADGDSVYSPYWVELLCRPLIEDETIACSFGRFAFLPDQSSPRFPYFLYETAGDIFKIMNQRDKDKAMYVYGCSSAYRKNQGIEVDGYEHPAGANEDGYLALKLSNKFGRLEKVTDNRSLVWTSNRRLMEQGGLWNAFTSRLGFLSKQNA